MPTVTVIPEADFDRDGDYETDLSTYFNERGGGLTVDRGAGYQGNVGEGTLSLNLDNFDGTFTLDYPSSSLYGQLEGHVPIRIRCRKDGLDYTLFTGYVSRYRPKFGRPGENRCAIEAKDLMTHLEGYPSANVTLDERTTDEAVEAVALAVELTSADLDLEPGVETLPYHWARNANALDAILDVVRSEMGGELFVNADGVIRFLARDTRLGSYSPTHTWGTGTNVIPETIEPELTDDDLISECKVQANIFTEDVPDVVIFALEAPIALTAGVPYEVEFDFPMPVEALDTTPTEDTDYQQNSAEDGTGTDQTSDLTVTITDLGAGFRVKLESASTGYVTKLDIHALPINPATSKPVFTHTLSLPGQKMPQGVTLPVPFAEDSQATRDYPVGVCRTYRYAYPFVRLGFAWDSDDIAEAMLAVELWDQVYFEDTGSGSEWLTNIADYFYVVGIQHSLQPGSVERTTVTLVPSCLYFNLDCLAYDSFDRDDATGDLGTATSGDVWASDSAMDIVSGTARASSDSAQTPNILLFESEDQVVEAQFANIGSGDEVGLVFSYEDSTHYSRAYVDKGSNEVILEHVIGAATTEIASPAYTVGTSAEIRVMKQDHRVRVWVDRRLYIDEVDSLAWIGHRVGIFLRNASGSATVDNWHAREI